VTIDNEAQANVTMPSEAWSYAAAAYAMMRVSAEFLADEPSKAVSAATAGADSTSVVLQGQHARLRSWLHSLVRLGRPEDVQAVVAGGRAIFEIAVDAVLLRNDMDGCQKVLDWEMSAKLKQAQAFVAHLAKAKRNPAREERHLIAFAGSQAGVVDQLRRKWKWTDRSGKPKHPTRWTGQDLGSDCAPADAVVSPPIFVEYYETRYRAVCWTTHGSGATGLRGIDKDSFPFLGAQSLRETTDFAFLASEETLRHLGQWTDSMKTLFDDARRQAKRRAAEVFGETQRLTATPP
jgi:hypothetical protein